ncbi:MAG: response regulator transcription factor [Anaerolineae bacterium]|jgi:two-component system response regulator NreC
MDPIRLLLVEDHEIVRAAIRALLGRYQDLEVVGETASGEKAVDLSVQLRPDVVLMDVTLPGMSGQEATRQILESLPEAKVLALSVHEEEAYFFQMFQAGACGYVPKRAAPHLLLTAIRAAAAGEVFLHPMVAEALVQTCVAQKRSDEWKGAGDGLTARQRQVLTLVAEGLTDAEISERLGVGVRTVQRHRANIRKQLNLRGRVDLVKYAVRKGLIQLDNGP